MPLEKLTAKVMWSDYVCGRPIEDLRSAQKLCANSIGIWGNIFRMCSKTFDVIGLSEQTKSYLNSKLFKITHKEFLELMWTMDSELFIDDEIEYGRVIVETKPYAISEDPFVVEFIGC